MGRLLYFTGMALIGLGASTAWPEPATVRPASRPSGSTPHPATVIPATITPVAPQTQRTAADANKVICHYRIATGSRLSYARDCHTRAEWDLITRESREYLRGITQRGLDSNNLPGGGGSGH